MRTQNGFTLIELVIAVAVFSLIGLGTYALFDTVFRVKERTDAHSEQLAQMQRAFMLIQKDFQQIVHRGIRDEFGDPQEPIVAQDAYQVEFTRIGWTLSPFSVLKRSDLQRVSYRMEENELVRSYWTMLDRTEDARSESTPLLGNIEDLRFRYFYSDEVTGDQWVESWPPLGNGAQTANQEQLPKIIEMNLDHKVLGTIRRVFRIAEVPPPQITQPVSGSNNPGQTGGQTGNQQTGGQTGIQQTGGGKPGS